ncbi:MAG: hypothetical protein WBW53_10320 [Terriglobales bacterium]
MYGTARNCPALEVLHDPRQLCSKPHAPPQVRFVRRSQRALDFRWKPATVFGAIIFDQVTRHERKNPMVLSQPKNFAPFER